MLVKTCQMNIPMNNRAMAQAFLAYEPSHSGGQRTSGNLGRYELVEEIGRGAMGIVYKASDPFIDRMVAIKTINLNYLMDADKKDYQARFYQEAKAAGRLNHPNIVTIFDLGETNGIAFIAMELLQGKELQNLLANGKRLPVEEALEIAIQVAAGLDYAHEHGVIHRDIKPSNIMVLKGGLVKIADFGIAQMAATQSQTQSGMVVGSPLYMSPEQICNRPLDRRSDIFSAGTLLHRMLTGTNPFSGNSIHSLMYQIAEQEPPKAGSINSAIPPALDSIIAKCMAKNPADRYQDAKSLGCALQACRDDLRAEQKDMAAGKSTVKVAYWKLAVIFAMLVSLFELLEEIGDKFLFK
jgi:serine/threonine protein kinase